MRIVTAVVLLALLCACGAKGPLYLPEDDRKAEQRQEERQQ